MWFGMLGPLLVRQHDREITVAAARQRVLLAALLIQSGRVVSAERLADDVWDGDPPGAAHATLQTYVMRLRQVLGHEAGSRLITRPPGYAIEACDDELDMSQFRALCAGGAAAVRAEAWEQACKRLDEALRLWRGPPLADIPSQRLSDAAVPQLRELWLQATELRIDAKLHLGRHTEVIAELQTLTVSHLLRERFYHQLMLALYRAARQADALMVYQQVRRTLVEEIGVEPGPELQELRQRILAADPELAGPAGSPPVRVSTAPVDAVPRQLPSSSPHFVGRAAELAALTRLSTLAAADPNAAAITAVCGRAGVGKTALVLHWSHQVAGCFPDGQLYVNLGGFGPGDPPMSSGQALSGFLRALEMRPERIPPDVASQAALFRSILAKKRLLVILDNARDADQVRPLLPGAGGCLTITTSRDQMVGLVAFNGAHLLVPGLLTRDEARSLLASCLGQHRIANEPGAADSIVELCGRLPLALSLISARAVACPFLGLATLVSQLHSAARRLDALDAGDGARDVRTAFSWSYRRLSDPAARLFRLFGLQSSSLTEADAARLAAMLPEQAREALAELSRYHLVNQPGLGSFSCDELLRCYAAELADS